MMCLNRPKYIFTETECFAPGADTAQKHPLCSLVVNIFCTLLPQNYFYLEEAKYEN